MNEILFKLRNSGLQEYESRAYYALVTYGNLTAKEISQKAEIPLTKVYAILNKLIDKGFCIRMQGNKKIYKALQPAIAFSKLVNEIKDNQLNIEQTVLELENIYKSDNKTIDDYIEVLSNNQQIHEKYVSLENAAKYELISFVKPPFSHDGNKHKIERQEEVEIQKLGEGIISKAIYEIPSGDDALILIPHIKKSLLEGAEARMLKEVPIKLHIFDRRYVLMALKNSDNSNTNLTMISIEHPDLAVANKILFDHLWEKAIPFNEYKAKYLVNKS